MASGPSNTAANTPEREAPCGCKWYADGTTYKCLSHRRFDGDPRAERIEPSAATRPPLYQPENTKLLRLTLTEDQWWKLAERATQCDLSLEQFVNAVVNDAVVNPRGGLV